MAAPDVAYRQGRKDARYETQGTARREASAGAPTRP